MAFEDDADGRELYNAAAWGEFEKVKCILNTSDIEEIINWQNPEGNTPLYIASAWGFEHHLETVKLLLEYGADINLANEKGQTPLYVAASWAHTHVVSHLIEKGALLNVQMENGRTALHVAACSKPHVNNYDTDKKYGKYSPFVMHFMFNNAKAYIEKLMKTGEYKDCFLDMDKDYKKLISCAVKQEEDIPDDIMDIVLYYNHFATVTELVRAGADLELKDDNLDTALDKARWSGHLSMECFLTIKSKK